MNSAVLICRIVLAWVFGIASVGKLMDLEASRRSLGAFGVDAGASRFLGTALPLVEAATAVLLLLTPTAQVGAAAAAFMFGVFVLGIANALRQGKTPDCNCFGVLHSAPAGRNTLGRNAAFAAIAIFALVEGPGPALDSWVAGRSGAVIIAVALSLAAVVLAAFSFNIWRRNRTLTTEVREAHRMVAGIPPGLQIGAVAPDFDVSDRDGGRLTLAGLRALGHPIMLIFSFPGCGVCKDFLPELEHSEPALSGRITFGFIGRETMRRAEAFEASRKGATGPTEYPPDLDGEMHELLELFHRYRLVGTPSAVLVTPDGYLASSTVDGQPAVEALIHVSLARIAAGSHRSDARGLLLGARR